MFGSKNRQKNYSAVTRLRSGSAFEVQGRCSLRVMTPGFMPNYLQTVSFVAHGDSKRFSDF